LIVEDTLASDGLDAHENVLLPFSGVIPVPFSGSGDLISVKHYSSRKCLWPAARVWLRVKMVIPPVARAQALNYTL
jgi:hypothetical protein